MNVDLFGNAIVEEQDFEVKVKKQSPFDFINDISKKHRPEDFENYNPFITNLSFSQRKDLVIFANEMNKYHQLLNQPQFDFYYYGLPKKNLFAKWNKKDNYDCLDDIKEYFGVNTRVAVSYLKVLTTEQKKMITDDINQREGGKAKKP